MLGSLVTVALLTGKMASVSAAGQTIMDRHEQEAKEREERSKR